MSYPNTLLDSAPAAQAADLSQPLRGASFGAAVKRYFTKYATFSGRASRSEYWWVALLNGVIAGALSAWMMAAFFAGIDPWTNELTGYGFLVPFALIMLYSLAILVPSLALLARRLHDGGYSAWFILLNFVPFVGGFIILVLALLPGKPEGARFDAAAQQQYVPYPRA